MDHLSAFLKKFKTFTAPEWVVREHCVEHVSELLGRPVSPSQIRVEGRVLYVDLPPMLKGEVLLEKEELLRRLREISPQASALLDIR